MFSLYLHHCGSVHKQEDINLHIKSSFGLNVLNIPLVTFIALLEHYTFTHLFIL